MLFHVSIEADCPRRVAEVVAELWGGLAAPFPAVAAGSWVALAGDDKGTMIEFYPRGTELRESDNGASGVVSAAPRRFNATHYAMATKLSQDEVLAIAAREGWPAKYCRRGDAFGVIEVWAEGCQLIEVLTGEMQAEYVGAVTIDNWLAMLRARELELPIAA
jgi:hypothetical protein